ncbi:ATP-dependent DNA helicase PIF4-like [Cynara cardunculus var. scolymus]|uniref:ATP-dependent DNA helicase PIF4-like n=1 Tax=Cynara cardunculus var. scolymus TaxID=59895 RepID=UPI000D624EBB|nr:ATP-dependent DNA helicase PIF4-like [Cynara cardunculus var. scolymus]
MGKSLDDFDLPMVGANANFQSKEFREVQEEGSIVVEEEHLRTRDSLNFDKKYAYDETMRHVDDDCPRVFFIDGPGGTGKTFLYKALFANIHSHGLIALPTASSGVAANNMLGGGTTHSRFRIPLNLDNNSMCNIKKQSGAAQLIRDAKIIIWDEASITKRQAVESLN